MNYYNPYFYSMPYVEKEGLFNRMFGNLSFGKVLNGTERALNFANQAIPIIKQVKPILNNARTMFKVINEFKRNETTIRQKPTTNTSGPNFFA